MKELDILHECGDFWVTTALKGGFNWDGFVIWQNVGTHSELRDRIGFPGHTGMSIAIKKCNARGLAQ